MQGVDGYRDQCPQVALACITMEPLMTRCCLSGCTVLFSRSISYQDPLLGRPNDVLSSEGSGVGQLSQDGG